MKWLTDIITSIKEKITSDSELHPWGTPDESKPGITDQEVEEAIDIMDKKKQRKTINPIILGVTKLSVILWVLCHLILLYMMIGSPTQGGVLVIVLINLNFLRHYMMLLGKIKNE